jgi:hypothetical protein
MTLIFSGKEITKLWEGILKELNSGDYTPEYH